VLVARVVGGMDPSSFLAKKAAQKAMEDPEMAGAMADKLKNDPRARAAAQKALGGDPRALETAEKLQRGELDAGAMSGMAASKLKASGVDVMGADGKVDQAKARAAAAVRIKEKMRAQGGGEIAELMNEDGTLDKEGAKTAAAARIKVRRWAELARGGKFWGCVHLGCSDPEQSYYSFRLRTFF